MANFNNIKNEIDQNVNTNGVQAITGAILNETLKDMIDEVDEKKQDTLTAGSGISIQNNVISATGGGGGGQEYYEGTAIDIDASNRINVVPSALPFYLAGRGLGSWDGHLLVDYSTIPSEIAGNGLQNDGNGRLEVRPSDLVGDGLDVDPNGKLAIDPTEVQEKLTAGDHIYIYDNIISATGLQEHLVSGQNIKTVNGNSLLGSGDIVISGGGGGNYLPLEGGTLQNTAPGEDTELKVIDGMDEDYVKIVAPESAGEKPHVEIFENGSGDTKIYYDHIERGSQVSIDLPSSSGTLALTSDIPEAGSGLIENASGEFEVDTTTIQEKLVAGQNITITGNVISSGQGYMAGTGIDITGNIISVDNTVATQNDLSGKQDTLTAGTGISIQNNVISATGGSGGSYTAGNGIDITNNTISVDATDLDGTGLTTNQNGELEVDTNVIQGKLTAGSGISIQNNVISATGGGGSGLWVNGTGTNSLLSPAAQANNSDATGTASIAGGKGSVLGNYSTAFGEAEIGNQTYPNSDYSFAAGNAKVYGSGTVGIGGVEIWGNNSVALGYSSTVMNADYAVALNAKGISSDYSFSAAGGYAGGGNPHTLAPWYQVSIGKDTKTYNESEVALGRNNKSSHGNTDDTKTFFSIGDSRWNVESNVFEIMVNDGLYVKSVGGYDGTNAGAAGIKTLQTVLNGKQDQLTAGTGITIQNNVISATGGSGQSYVAGNGIDITGNTISVDNTIATTSDLSGKQDTLVSGTNIKTVNGQSLLGSGGIIIYTEGDGITIDRLNNKISVDNFYLGDQYLSLTGGMLQGDSDSTTITSIEVVSPDSNVAGYILSQSEDTSDPDNPVPASVEIGLSGQPSGSTDATQGISLRSNGTIAVNYLDSQGNIETAELEFPRKSPGQTYTIATLDDIQGGTSYTAGSGIDITGSTISVDASDLDGSGLSVDANGALEVDTTTIQEKLQAGANISISGSTISATDTTYSAGSGLSLNGTTFSADTTVLATQNDLSGKQDTLVSGTNIKTINGNSILGSGDITVGGGGSSYTAGNGIDITGTTISADDTYFDGKYLSLNGGSISDQSQGATGTTLIVAEPSQNYDAYVSIMADEGDPTAKEGQVSISGTHNGNLSSLQIYSNRIFAGGNGDIYFPSPAADDTFALASEVSAKQDTLVSGTNIKTINGNSLLGSGDIQISAGSSYQAGNGIGIQNDTISVLYDSTRGIGYDNSVGHNELFVQLGNGLQFDGNGAIETTGGSSYTAGTGISIDSSNVITNTAPSLWVAGTGSRSIKSPTATGAEGARSIAIGDMAEARAADSIAIGYGAQAMKLESIALGKSTTANGPDSVAIMGGNTGTNAEYSVALGYQGKTTNTYEIGLGKFNLSTGTGTTAEKTQFTIGNGAYRNEKNVLEIKQNNDTYLIGVGGFDGTNPSSSQTLQTVINGKQDTLTAGTGISISGNVISATGGSGSGSYLPLAGGTLEGASTSTSLVIQAPQSESTANITLEALGTGSSSISLTSESSIPTDVGDFEINSDGSFTLNYVSGTNDTITLPKTTGTIALQGDLAGNNNYTESAIVYSIGIGTSSNPLNALAVDSSGNIFIKGLGGYTGHSISGATSIQTLLSSNSNESNPSGTEITNQDDPSEGGWD